MRPADLSPEDQSLVAACLRAASAGPFFPDWEFQTLFGVEREVVASVAGRWPAVDLSDDDVELAIIGSMNHLLGYPHGYPLAAQVGYGAEAIRAVLEKVMGR